MKLLYTINELQIRKTLYRSIFWGILLIILLCLTWHVDTWAMTDVDPDYEEQVHLLEELGVVQGYEDGLFHGEKPVTRGEFSKMAVSMARLMGQSIQPSETKYSLYFQDVTPFYWAYSYVMDLAQSGRIQGNERGLFEPGNPVTLAQGLKMMIDGSEQRAKGLGGYPTGYLQLGKNLGVIGESVDKDYRMTRYDVADLLYQCYRMDAATELDVNDDGVMDIQATMNPIITWRSLSDLQGRIQSQDPIDWIRWRFLTTDGKQIMATRVKNPEEQEVDLAFYRDQLSFQNLGVGHYQFILEAKLNTDIVTILDRTISVTREEDGRSFLNKEHALLNMPYLNISQSMGGTGGHQGTYALDLSGIDSGSDTLYAPFDGVITKIYSEDNGQNFVWLESLEKLHWADGTYDYVTVMTGHDLDITNLYVGQEITQGEPYYQEGSSGRALGNHIHLEVAKGKISDAGWQMNIYGNWHIENMVPPNSVFYIPDTVTLIDTKDMTFMREGE